MTLQDFELQRADVSHCLLRNGIFSRLGAKPTNVEAQSSVEARVIDLEKCSMAVISEQANIQKAAATWLKGDGVLCSVKHEIIDLVENAKDINSLMPGPDFPNLDELKARIERCDSKMRSVSSIFEMDSNKQAAWLSEFWRDALAVNDIVSSFSMHGSNRFWGVFRSRKGGQDAS